MVDKAKTVIDSEGNRIHLTPGQELRWSTGGTTQFVWTPPTPGTPEASLRVADRCCYRCRHAYGQDNRTGNISCMKMVSLHGIQGQAGYWMVCDLFEEGT